MPEPSSTPAPSRTGEIPGPVPARAGRALIGRGPEESRLGHLLEELLAGRGRALLLHGPAGIGKSALLSALHERALDRGVAVLTARGVEGESELAFVTLVDLLAPLHGDLASLPGPQGEALGAALALAPPRPGDRFAVCVATLGLLRAGAGRRPVLALVDDLQWTDAASRECLLYAARRAGGALAVVVAERDGPPGPRPADLPRLAVGGLDAADALGLLADRAPDLAPAVAAAVATAAAGVPLALVELPTVLAPAQRCGVDALVEPLLPGPRMAEVYGRRVDALPPRGRRALLLAALHEGDELAVLERALTALGCRAADLEPAEAAGLVHLAGGRLAFGHPLARGAAYQRSSPAQRRSAHAALAGVLTGPRRAWHLGEAALGPDEEVAAELEEAGRDTLARRAPGPASVVFERAARLSPGSAPRARRLLAAAEAAASAGSPERAVPLLEEVAVSGQGALRAPARHLLGLVLLWTRGVEPAVRVLEREAEEVLPRDPARAAAMLADASVGVAAAGDTRRALELASRAAALVGDPVRPVTAVVRARVLAVLAWAALLRGEGGLGRWALQEVERSPEALDPLGAGGPGLEAVLHCHLVLGDLEHVALAGQRACERVRGAGAIASLPNLLVVVADVAYRAGDWTRADEALGEALRTGDEVGQGAGSGHAAAVLAQLAAARGREGECRATAAAVLEGSRRTGMLSGLHFAHAALGLLELGLEHTGAALAQLQRTALLAEESGLEEPTLVPWAPDLVEACVRAGRTEEARRAVEVLARRTAAASTTTAATALARCRGLVEEDYDPPFVDALRLDDARPMPFERARTRLAYGRRLHRARRRAEAREHLGAALDGFTRLGAAPWVAQAEAELRAAGGRRAPVAGGELTAQERRVAAAVLRGASNREVAAELYLSPKTVEFHLDRIYRKLGVRSRTQLSATLERGPAMPP